MPEATVMAAHTYPTGADLNAERPQSVIVHQCWLGIEEW
jgi:hypothetical protein